MTFLPDTYLEFGVLIFLVFLIGWVWSWVFRKRN